MQYLAPEQLEEKDIDTRADFFSFGCIFYEMITGQKMFPDRNLTKLIKKRLVNDFAPLSSYDITIPEDLIRLINQCLELQVNKRPEDIRAVLEKLEKIHTAISPRSPEEVIQLYVKGENFEEKEIYVTKGFGNRKLSAAAIISLCTVLIVVFFFALFSRPKKKAEGQIAAHLKSKELALEAEKVKPEPVPAKEPPADENTEELSPAVKETVVVAAINVPVEQTKDIIVKKVAKPGATPGARTAALAKGAAKKAALAGKTPIILEELYKKYNTNDYLFVMKEEADAKNYATVLEIFQTLTPAQTSGVESRLLRHRALVGTKKADNAYYENFHINDGEFFLSKARFLYERKQYQRALWMLGSIETAPVTLLDKKTIQREGLYYRAKCNTALFYSAPAEEKQKTAMQSWFDVKSEFRTNQAHPYFVEANNEIREISKKSSQ